MAHITEHPLRAKRRKLDDDTHPAEDVNFSSPAQLGELLVFQQNPATAKQGQSIAASHVRKVPSANLKDRSCHFQGVSFFYSQSGKGEREGPEAEGSEGLLR